MKIVAEEDKCVGAGQCVLSAPAVFDQDDDGIVIILNAEPADSERGNVDLAIRLCPARALVVGEG
jgi:ferredoxin